MIDKDTAVAFRTLLREAMAKNGYKTQEQLAEAAGVSQSLVSSLLVGPSPFMRAMDLFKVLKPLHIEPNEVSRVFGIMEPVDARRMKIRQVVMQLEKIDSDTLDDVLSLVETMLIKKTLPQSMKQDKVERTC